MRLFTDTKKLLAEIEFSPRHLLAPMLLAVLAACFEGLSTGLLIPILQGLIDGNFERFQSTLPGRGLGAVYPGIFEHSMLFTFGCLLLLILAATAARIALVYSAQISFTGRLRRAMHLLRTLLFRRCLGFGRLYYDRTKQGSLHNVVLGFTTQIERRLQRVHGQLQWLLLIVVYVALMLVISWPLTLFVLMLFPLCHAGMSKLIARIRTSSQNYADADNAVSSIFHSTISCISLVKACGTEQRELERFRDSSERGAALGFDIDRKLFLIYPIQEAITLAAGLLVVSCIAIIVSTDPARDVSHFLVFVYLLKRCSTGFSALGDLRGLLASLHGLFREIGALLEDSGKHSVPSGSRPFPGLTRSIEFRNLTFAYVEEMPVLRDISFTVERGATTALVGPSGSGKSTITHLLLRFYDCPPGSILIDGTDIRELDTKSLRASIAHVSQDSELFHDTLRANILYGARDDVPEERMAEAVRTARLDELVGRLPRGLETLVGDQGVQLSGGEKQRVSIARAILRDPELLILDEATSALDSTTERLIQEALEELVQDRTVIVIAHRFSTVQNADKIVTIEHGRVVESGSLTELLERGGAFADLWKDQALFH